MMLTSDSSVLAGSVGTRPAKRIDGDTELLETL
jgi:hypothetical protein